MRPAPPRPATSLELEFLSQEFSQPVTEAIVLGENSRQIKRPGCGCDIAIYRTLFGRTTSLCGVGRCSHGIVALSAPPNSAWMSMLSSREAGAWHQNAHDWGECFTQCGDGGIVLESTGVRRTAFFEAFPRDPNTFLRGEGQTIAIAENDAWKRWQNMLACPEHDYDVWENGAAQCKRCGFFYSRYSEQVRD